MPQYIPGPEALLAPAAREITEGVMNYLNPNRDFQKQMQTAIGSNPALLQQLADLEHGAPGALEQLGFGKLAAGISQVPESREAEFGRTNRGELQKAAGLNLRNEITKNENLASILGEAADEIAKNSDLTRDAVYQMLLGQTESESKIKREQARAAPAKATAEIAGAELETEVIKDTIADLPEIGETDLYKTARDFRSGRLEDYSVISSIYRTPGAKETFTAILNRMDRLDDQAHQRSLTAMRPNSADNSWLNRATERYRASGMAGSIQAWEKFLRMDASDRAKVAELSNKPAKELTVEEREMLEVHSTERDMFQQRTETAQRVFARDLQLLMGRARTATKDVLDKSSGNPRIAGELLNINNLLREHAQRTGRSLTARYGRVPESGWRAWVPGGEKGFFLEDENGNIVDPDEVAPVNVAPNETPSIEETDEYQTVLANLMAMDPNERTMRLEELRGIDANMYNSMKAYFESSSDTTRSR